MILNEANRVIFDRAPKPQYRDEYDRGQENGTIAFNSAMRERYKELTGGRGEDSEVHALGRPLATWRAG